MDGDRPLPRLLRRLPPRPLHLHLMTQSGVPPNNFAFPAALKSAGGLHDLLLECQLHASLIKHNYHSSPVTVANTLITMYAKCGDFDSALNVFDRITDRDQVSWNSVIAVVCMFEKWELALESFRAMQEDGVYPSSFTVVAVLACSNLSHVYGLKLGKQEQGVELGFIWMEGRLRTMR